MATTRITWDIEETPPQARGVSWYAVAFLVALFSIYLAFTQDNYSFVVVVFLAYVSLMYAWNRTPRVIFFEVNQEGILIEGKKLYQYADLQGFATLNLHSSRLLVLRPKQKARAYLKIPLPLEDTDHKVEEFLTNFLKRIEYEEPLTDVLSRMLGF